MTPTSDLGSARSLLGQATLVLFRYWWIVILAIVLLSGAALAILFIAGHCCQSITDPMALESGGTSGDRGPAHNLILAAYAFDLARYLIAIVSLLIFFLVADPGLGRSGTAVRPAHRALWIFGRLIVHRLVVVSVSVTYWAISNFVLIPVFVRQAPGAGAGYAHLGLLLCLSVVSSYLYAKVVFYVPACAYREEPESFVQAWRATRGVTRILFVAYLPFVAFSVTINLLLGGFGSDWLWVNALPEALARWTQIPAEEVTNLLPGYLGQSVAAVTSLIMAGPVSLAAYSAVFGREQRVAGVFA